jgi:hypothetical protein
MSAAIKAAETKANAVHFRAHRIAQICEMLIVPTSESLCRSST